MNIPELTSRTPIDDYYFTGNLVGFFESGNVKGLVG